MVDQTRCVGVKEYIFFITIFSTAADLNNFPDLFWYTSAHRSLSYHLFISTMAVSDMIRPTAITLYCAEYIYVRKNKAFLMVRI